MKKDFIESIRSVRNKLPTISTATKPTSQPEDGDPEIGNRMETDGKDQDETPSYIRRTHQKKRRAHSAEIEEEKNDSSSYEAGDDGSIQYEYGEEESGYGSEEGDTVQRSPEGKR